MEKMKKRKKILVGLVLLSLSLTLMACEKETSTKEAALEDLEGVTQTETTPEEGYQLGNKMPDFTAHLDDGTEVTLYGLLKDKKAVLINFWASWCGPCKNEFPFMQQAYSEMSDDIGIIALSTEASDTFEVIADLKKELSISSIPMGLDDGQLYNQFGFDAIPASIMVDRNGVICFMEVGSIPSKDHFIRLFSVFTEDGYNESVILEKIPAKAAAKSQPDETAMKTALGIKDDAISVLPLTDTFIWPFIPDSNEGVKATNTSEVDTRAQLCIDVAPEAGAGVCFQYLADYGIYNDGLFSIMVDDELVRIYDTAKEWNTDYIDFEDETVTHKVVFEYIAENQANKPTDIGIKNIRIINGKELNELQGAEKKAVKTLSGTDCKLEFSESQIKPVIVTYGQEKEEDFCIRKSDELTCCVRLGEAVNEHLAIITDGKEYHLVGNLPNDEQGYLYTWKASEEDEQFESIAVYANISDANSADSIIMLKDEAALDALLEQFASMEKDSATGPVSFEWEYADGSPRITTKATGSETAKNDAGIARYAIQVVDKSGNPIEGVILQFCDAQTCQVLTTDKNGQAEMEAEPYAYEIHVLKVPDGYSPDTTLYTLPKEGGELTVTLQ